MNSKFKRRAFLGAVILGAAGILQAGNIYGAPEVSPPEGKYEEPRRQIDLIEEVDVIVCGAGPAGFGAAISAARSGAKTLLFDVNGCLGGVWTAGMLTYIFDIDKPGLPREITRRLDERHARVKGNDSRYVYHVEEMKCLLEEMAMEEKITAQLHTRLVAAYKDSSNRLETVITESKSGRQAWRAKVFIDASGDGDLGALAGCEWKFGEKAGPDCPCQPLTMNALITVPSVEAIKDFVLLYKGDDDWKSWQNQARKRFLKEIKRAGIDPSYGAGTLLDLMFV